MEPQQPKIVVQQFGCHLLISSSGVDCLALCFSEQCSLEVDGNHLSFSTVEPIPDDAFVVSVLPTLDLLELRQIAIKSALRMSEGNVTRAAELLGCSRASLHEWRKETK